jgi:hypothetical protein
MHPKKHAAPEVNQISYAITVFGLNILFLKTITTTNTIIAAPANPKYTRL